MGIQPQDILKFLEDNWKAIVGLGGGGGGILGIIGYVIKRRTAKRDSETARRDAETAAQRTLDNQLFADAVAGLRNNDISARTSAATTLLTFLDHPGYKQFHQQIFDLSVTYLRSRRVESENPGPDVFYSNLIRVFKGSAPLVRKTLSIDALPKDNRWNAAKKYLNASGVHLDGAELQEAQLQYINLENATFTGRVQLSGASFYCSYLVKANLSSAMGNQVDFRGATLMDANLSQASLRHTDFSDAFAHWTNLQGAQLSSSIFHNTNLTGAKLQYAKLIFSSLRGADLSGAKLNFAKLSYTGLSGVNFSKADLSKADLSNANLSGANPEEASDLNGARMLDVKGYDDPIKRQQCREKGAIFS